MKKLVALTVHTTAEGKRCAYMYSVIDADGNITDSNKRGNCVVLDDAALEAIAALEDFVQRKLDAEE